jgi:lysophospholipase L1-like esterase
MKPSRVFLLLVAALLLVCTQNAAAAPVWIASWAAAQQQPEPANALPADALHDGTLRQVFRLSVGGQRLRVHLSNLYGNGALRFTSVHIARPRASNLPDIDPATDRSLTFTGKSDALVPAGAELVSDPIDFPAASLSDLTVSFHLDAAPSDPTGHPGSRATSYYAHGDQTASAQLKNAEPIDHWYQISAIDVEAASSAGVIAVLGDSITDGRGSTTNGNDRWTNFLSSRLNANQATHSVGLVNLGIGGNCILAGGLGPNLLARFERDALTPAGARWLVVFEGINDLGELARHGNATSADRAALVSRITVAYQQMIARAHARGLLVYGATLTPWSGSEYYHPNAADEAGRQAVNAWIRSAGHFDAVLDFDRALGDPAHPDRLLPAYDSGDHLHP